MKRLYKYSVLILSILGFWSCEKDPKVESMDIAVSKVSSVTATTALVTAEVTQGKATITQKGVCWSVTSNPTISDSVVYSESSDATSFSCQLKNLQEDKTITVRAFVSNASGVMYSEPYTFSTSTKLVITTLEVGDKQGTCAMAGGSVDAGSDTTITRKGLCWSLSPNPTINDSIVYTDNSSNESKYVLWMRNLTSSTTYYYRAFVTNAVGTSYGNEKSFTTLDNPVLNKTSLGAVEVENNQYYVVCTGDVTDTVPGVSINQCGFCFSKKPNPTIEDQVVNAETVQFGTFNDTVWVEIEENVTYYVRSFVISSNGVAYGEQSSFLTWSLPVISIFNAYSITSSSATEGAVIVSDGSAPILSRGFCWTIESNVLPTIEENQKITVESNNSIFYGNLTNLTSATTYYVRAYVTNKIGTSYSDVISFTTKE